jgi:rhodanese-related sulfurtransferase
MNAMALNGRSYLWMLAILLLVTFKVFSGHHGYNIKEVTAPEAKALMSEGAVVIDVRDGMTQGRPHLPGAFLIPEATITAGIASLKLEKTAKIVVYCGDGSTHGPAAADALRERG